MSGQQERLKSARSEEVTDDDLALAMRRGTVPVVQLGGWQLRDAGGHPVPGPPNAGSPEEALRLTGLWPA